MITKIQIVLVHCTRGVIFTRTVEAAEKAMKLGGYMLSDLGLTWERRFTWDEPIPDAQNHVIREALELDPQYIWMVEEDIIPPEDSLIEMSLEMRKENWWVNAAQYKLLGGTWAHHKDADENLLYAGLGSILMKAELFRKIPYPWFRTGYSYDFKKYGDVRLIGHSDLSYGQQDTYFFAALHQTGIPLGLSNVVCRHQKLIQLGLPNQNNGVHHILEL